MSADLSIQTERPATSWAARPGWGIAVDLMPREVLQGRRTRVQRRLVVLALVVVLLACGGAALMSFSSRSAAQQSFDDEQARTAQLQVSVNEYADITAATGVLTDTATQAKTLMSQDVDVVSLLARIRNALPDAVTIGNVAVLRAPADASAPQTAGGHSVIGTVTISGGGTQIKQLAPFIADLNHLRGVVDVVPGSTTQTEDGMTYSLSLNFTDALYTHRFDQVATP